MDKPDIKDLPSEDQIVAQLSEGWILPPSVISAMSLRRWLDESWPTDKVIIAGYSLEEFSFSQTNIADSVSKLLRSESILSVNSAPSYVTTDVFNNLLDTSIVDTNIATALYRHLNYHNAPDTRIAHIDFVDFKPHKFSNPLETLYNAISSANYSHVRHLMQYELYVSCNEVSMMNKRTHPQKLDAVLNHFSSHPEVKCTTSMDEIMKQIADYLVDIEVLLCSTLERLGVDSTMYHRKYLKDAADTTYAEYSNITGDGLVPGEEHNVSPVKEVIGNLPKIYEVIFTEDNQQKLLAFPVQIRNSLEEINRFCVPDGAQRSDEGCDHVLLLGIICIPRRSGWNKIVTW